MNTHHAALGYTHTPECSNVLCSKNVYVSTQITHTISCPDKCTSMHAHMHMHTHTHTNTHTCAYTHVHTQRKHVKSRHHLHFTSGWLPTYFLFWLARFWIVQMKTCLSSWECHFRSIFNGETQIIIGVFAWGASVREEWVQNFRTHQFTCKSCFPNPTTLFLFVCVCVWIHFYIDRPLSVWLQGSVDFLRGFFWAPAECERLDALLWNQSAMSPWNRDSLPALYSLFLSLILPLSLCLFLSLSVYTLSILSDPCTVLYCVLSLCGVRYVVYVQLYIMMDWMCFNTCQQTNFP